LLRKIEGKEKLQLPSFPAAPERGSTSGASSG
jgi:hypothetical protein